MKGQNFLIGTIFVSGMGILKVTIDLDKKQIIDFEKKSYERAVIECEEKHKEAIKKWKDNANKMMHEKITRIIELEDQIKNIN